MLRDRRRLRVGPLSVALMGGGFRGAYDGVPIVAAFSTRRLRAAYAGNLLRIRRDADDAEANFGYTANGDLDTAAIATWLGASAGYVVTWYDQSGNGRNATQANKVAQPEYVASAQNSLPVLRCSANGFLSLSGTALDIFQNVDYGAVLFAGSASAAHRNDIVYYSRGGSTAAVRFLFGVGFSTLNRLSLVVRRLDTDAVASISSSVDAPAGWALAVAEMAWGTRAGRVLQNGVAVAENLTLTTAGNTSNTPSELFSILGVAGTAGLQGDCGELVITNSTWSDAVRLGAETATNAYWDIY